jgi:uncharacterized protein YndB with AHSA1/START domain
MGFARRALVEKTGFVHVTHIAATADKVWQALTEGELTQQYWDRENVSDWIAGSSWEHRRLDVARTIELTGTVLESSPPHRLVLTWARPQDADDPARVSRVSFDIQPEGDGVRLTVRHADLQPDSEMLRAVRQGWPKVLANLKALVESRFQSAA